MAKLHSELILGLTDNVSGPARRIDQNLENMRRQQQRVTESFNAHRNAMATTAVAAFVMANALNTPIQNAIAFENKLVDIQQKARMTADELEKLGGAIRTGGLETGVGAQSYGEAVDGLMAGGLDATTSVAAANPLAKTSIAYEASVDDMVAASTALLQNMGITTTELESAFDIMAVGGKEGRFELKDMAGEFPAITAAARALGMEGKDSLASLVAWLQISMKGAATGSEAATNMSNFMQKVLAPDAVKKFGAAGIDIVGELKKATELGIDPIEHAVGLINGITGGDRAKLGAMFADTEVLKFLLQATTQLEEYKRIREAATNSQGTVEQDYAIRMDSSGGVLARFDASVQELNLAIGGSLTPKLNEFIKSITPMVDGVASFVRANEELVSAVVQVTAALIGLKMLSHAGGILNALLGMDIGGSGNKPGSAKNGGPGGGPRKGPNLGGLGLMGFNAIGIMLDYKAFGDEVRADGGKAWLAQRDAQDAAANEWLAGFDIGGFKPFQVYQGAIDAIHRPQGGIAGINTGPTQGQIDALKGQIAELDAEIAVWPEDGMEARRAGLATKLAEMQANFATASGALTSEMTSVMNRLRVIAASGVTIPMRVAGPQVSPVVTRASIAGGRASGGPVRGGSTYEINELGQEYFTPNSNGFIHKAGSFQPPGMPSFGGGAQGGGGGAITFQFGDLNVQTPTNANPHEIARALGTIVSDRLRASHSNGAM